MPAAGKRSKLQHDFLPGRAFEAAPPRRGERGHPDPKDTPEVPATPPRAPQPQTAIATKHKARAAEHPSPVPSSPLSSTPDDPRPAPYDAPPSCLLLFHTQCLRVRDNPALYAAAQTALPVVPVFLWAPHEEGELGIGGAARVFLLESLKALQRTLRLRFSAPLVLRRVPPTSTTADAVADLVGEVNAVVVLANRQYEPQPMERDARVAQRLSALGVGHRQHNASLLWQPWEVPVPYATQPRGHFGTLMSFMRPAMATGPPATPVPTPATLRIAAPLPASLAEEDLGLYRAPIRRHPDGRVDVVDWAAPIVSAWQFGEEAAWGILEQFLQKGLPNYEKHRGRADIETAVSRLSPFIHFGVLSVREMYWKVREALRAVSSPTFSRRLVWRDLAYWQLHMFPSMPFRSMRPHYENLSWNTDPEKLAAWQKGMTGYPLVDAGMRELWLTGWMHQNVRMVTALFLVEYLGIHWIEGLRWYHDTLVDADLAINAMMWQNAGGSGLDHWNFAIHPVHHAKFCDPEGKYVRRWVPELKVLPNAFVHQPWEAPEVTLRHAGVVLGKTYPQRVVVDLPSARAKTLSWFVDMKTQAGPSACDERGYDLIPINGHKVRVYTKPGYRVTFQPRSAVANKPAKQTNSKRDAGRKHRARADEGTPMSEFTACLHEAMQSYRGQ